MQSEIQTGEYGEIVRTVDPGAQNLSLVYNIVTWISLASVLVSLLGAIVIGGLETRVSQAVAIGIVAFFFFWTLFGFLSLMRLESGISSEMNTLRAAKERAAREARFKANGQHS